MKTKKTLAVIGGDSRQIHLASYLNNCGYVVRLAAFSLAPLPHDLQNHPLREAADSLDTVILPLPVSRDGQSLNAVFAQEPILLQDLLRNTIPGTTIYCGMPSLPFEKSLQAHGCRVIDYFKDEDLTLHNALLTAEGVVGILIEQLPVTVFGLSCAVLGYGRVAQYTARTLKNIGAEVTVFARNKTALTKAATDGLKCRPLDELVQYIKQYTCIINTIPATVVDAACLVASDKNCTFIEVASTPYGIDMQAAKEIGRTVIKAASLPGKTAPKTAGEIIAKTIHRHITEGS